MSIEDPRINLPENSKYIWYNLPKYCKDNETIIDAMTRVANEVGTNEEEVKDILDLQATNKIRFNTPVYFNAGKNQKDKVFSACYVANVEDSMDSIYDLVNVSRKVFQYGSGIGMHIGNLREKNAPVFSKTDPNNPVPDGIASGPTSFMTLYNAVGNTTKSGGRVRRAAILMSMNVDHPDILDFINSKKQDKQLDSMNISINITDKFMNALKDKTPFVLTSPTGQKKNSIDPNTVWDKTIDTVWENADPGILFIDNINKMNVLKKTQLIKSTNPCLVGETIVQTINGEMTIRELYETDYQKNQILTYNIEEDKVEWESIVWCGETKEVNELIEIELDNGKTLQCTLDHKIYTLNRGWVEAQNLTEEDEIKYFG